VAKPTILVESDEIVRHQIQQRYFHILVDEYQDVNRASIRLLRAIKPDGQGLWVVGDAKQSIYRFRGASSFNIKRFETEDFPGGSTSQLTTNYRSNQEICNAFSAFARGGMSAAEPDFEAKALKGEAGIKPIFVSVESKEAEIDEIAARICKARDEGIDFKDQGVLCKGNIRLAEIDKGLEKRGLPVLFLGPLFDRLEIKQALSILSIIVDPRAMGLTLVTTMPEFQMPLNDVAACIEALAEGGTLAPLDWLKILPSLPGLSEEGRNSSVALAEVFSNLVFTATPWRILTQIYLDKTRIAARLAEEAETGSANPAIALWQFQNFLRTAMPESSSLPITDLLNHIRQLIILSDERDLRDLPEAAQDLDAIRLMTIHGSKGLEFKALYLPTLTKASIPHFGNQNSALALPDGMIEGALHRGKEALKSGHDEEQECLFFVALSRAEDQLTLLAPAKRSDGKNQSRSPFVDHLTSFITSEAPLAEPCGVDEADGSIDIVFEEPPRITPSQLAMFDKCPRRFFYAHILRLGGRRIESALMKMHNVVQVIVDDLVGRHEIELNADDFDTLFDAAWNKHGPIDHGHADEYRHIARDLLGFFLELRSSGIRRPPSPLVIRFGAGELVVIAHEEFIEGGMVTYRRVRTGQKTDSAMTGLEAAAYQLATAAHGTTEFVFLSGRSRDVIAISKRSLENRLKKIEKAALEITDGRFHASPGVHCPRCPYFFVCGPLPTGPISKKIGASLPAARSSDD
jgi:superfamily I DNA/RNA helicase